LQWFPEVSLTTSKLAVHHLPEVSVVDSSVTWGYLPLCLSDLLRHPRSLADGPQTRQRWFWL